MTKGNNAVFVRRRPVSINLSLPRMAMQFIRARLGTKILLPVSDRESHAGSYRSVSVSLSRGNGSTAAATELCP